MSIFSSAARELQIAKICSVVLIGIQFVPMLLGMSHWLGIDWKWAALITLFTAPLAPLIAVLSAYYAVTAWGLSWTLALLVCVVPWVLLFALYFRFFDDAEKERMMALARLFTRKS